jgi:hypothetical protein
MTRDPWGRSFAEWMLRSTGIREALVPLEVPGARRGPRLLRRKRNLLRPTLQV